MTPLSFRQLFALGFLACAFAMAFALYLQYVKGQEPCPLCVLQRVAMIGTGLFFLIGALHGPAARGRWVYAGLTGTAALIGVAIAARHVWLQSLPPDQVPACGPTLDYLLDVLPLREVLTTVLRGDADCAKIGAQWLGLSLPWWTLMAFSGLALYAALAPLASRQMDQENEMSS